MRRGGFFAGAVGGLALALLLVGVVSFLPQSGGVPQAASTQGQSQPEAAAATSTSVYATTTSTCFASPAPQALCAPSQAVRPNSSAVAGGLAALGNAAVSSSSALSASRNSSAPAVSASKAATPRPSSLITALPGEGVGTLLGTVSPLLIGLLVAALVYGAYARRQDAPPSDRP